MNISPFRTAWFALMIAAMGPAVCRGHGRPIMVNVAAGQLTVSNGTADTAGYANWIFADPDPESWLLPISVSEQFTEQPGFIIEGMNAGESLSMEIISRPDLTQPDAPQRWLWHWSLANEEVATAPNDPTLQILSQRGFGLSDLTQSSPPAAKTVKLADVLGGDIGEHRHLLGYFLDDAPAAPAGVYGIFARLTSPSYAPSEPFLIALNLNTFDVAKYQAGAAEINLAAGLAGDFDADSDVDGADFLSWQRNLGDTGVYHPADGSLSGAVDAADLAIWRTQFGRAVQLSAAAAATPTPEPAALTLAAMLAAALAVKTVKTGSRG